MKFKRVHNINEIKVGDLLISPGWVEIYNKDPANKCLSFCMVTALTKPDVPNITYDFCSVMWVDEDYHTSEGIDALYMYKVLKD